MSVYRWLGYFAGALSIASLLVQAISQGWVAPMQAIFDYYHSALEVLLGWATPAIDWIAAAASYWFPETPLYVRPSWKHSIVLSTLVVAVAVRTFLQSATVYKLSKFEVTTLLLFVAFVFANGIFTFTPSSQAPGPISQWLITNVTNNVEAVRSVLVVVNYLYFSAILLVIVPMLLIFFFLADRELRSSLTASELMMTLRVAAWHASASALAPIAGALLFIITNAGLKFVGMG